MPSAAVICGTEVALAISSSARWKALEAATTDFAVTSSLSLILASSVFKSASAAGCPAASCANTRCPAASTADGSFFASMLVFKGCTPFEPSR